MSDKVIITEEILELGKSSNGGWSKYQFSLLGITWGKKGLKPGWKDRIIGKEFESSRVEKFITEKDKHIVKSTK
jgi:hypothetical protein